MPRGSRSPFSSARITQGCLALLFAVAGSSLVYVFLDDASREAFGRAVIATSDGVWRDGKVWTLLTSWLVEPEFVALIFAGFVLWMFMPALERWWGLKRFLIFTAAVSIVGTTAGTLVGYALGDNAVIAGLAPFVYAGIAAYGVLFARHPVRFFGVLPMTGKQLALGITAFVAVFIVFTQDWAVGASYASAMAVAWMIASDRFRPKLAYLKWRQKRIRRHLKLVPGKDDKKWLN